MRKFFFCVCYIFFWIKYNLLSAYIMIAWYATDIFWIHFSYKSKIIFIFFQNLMSNVVDVFTLVIWNMYIGGCWVVNRLNISSVKLMFSRLGMKPGKRNGGASDIVRELLKDIISWYWIKQSKSSMLQQLHGLYLPECTTLIC